MAGHGQGRQGETDRFTGPGPRRPQARVLETFAQSGGAGHRNAMTNRLDILYDATFHDPLGVDEHV
jgi:hypothetical protein